jgi:hypothetical protein
LPLTREAANNAFSSHRLLRVVGLISLPMAIIHDVAKLLYYLAGMAIALSQSKYKRIKAEKEISDKILESLLLSLEAVLIIVVRLGLQTREDMEQEI